MYIIFPNDFEKSCGKFGTFLRLRLFVLLSVSYGKHAVTQAHSLLAGQWMSKPPADESPVSPLSPHRAFVVQLREEADIERGRWAGRVEHVTSGRATHFKSLEQMVRFIAETLPPASRNPSDEGLAT